MNNEDLTFIQDQIGYNFNNLDLLQQAFVRKSYAQENGGEDNEVLEFIGDKALDFVIVKLLSEHFGFYLSECDDYNTDEDFNEFCCEYSEGKLTQIKSNIVSKKTLAQKIDSLQFADYLIMGVGDKKNKVYEQDSVKEDLFEAIIGAVALDSEWDMDAVQDVVEIMLTPESYFDNTEDNYVDLIQQWNLRINHSLPLRHFEPSHYTETWYCKCGDIVQNIDACDIPSIKYKCMMKLGDLPIFTGFGSSKNNALKAVCELAYKYMEKNELLYTIQDEIENPNRAESISQLEILARRGYFSIPTYKFSQIYDNNGNSIWKCECRIKEYDKYYRSENSSKKEAKKSVAYKMLKYVMKQEEK